MTLLYSQIKEETLHVCALLSKSITSTLCSTTGNYKFAASPSMFFFSSLSKKTTPSLKELKDMSMTAPCSQTNKILLYVCLFSGLLNTASTSNLFRVYQWLFCVLKSNNASAMSAPSLKIAVPVLCSTFGNYKITTNSPIFFFFLTFYNFCLNIHTDLPIPGCYVFSNRRKSPRCLRLLLKSYHWHPMLFLLSSYQNEKAPL